MTAPSNIRALPPRHAAAIHRWVHLVAEHHGLAVADLRAGSRVGGLPRARWVAMLLLHEDGLSQSEIAAQLGLRDASTVQHGLYRARTTPELLALAAGIRAAGETRHLPGLRCEACGAPATSHPEMPGTRHAWSLCLAHAADAAAALNRWLDDQWSAQAASR